MPIAGAPPEHGVRFRLSRLPELPDAAAAGATVVYEGQITTATREFAVHVEVRADGEVVVTSDAGPDLVEKARLLVRTVVKHAQSEGQPPPRLIQRWRGDK